MVETSPDGWTLDTLKEHLTSRIDGLKENVGTAMAASDKAIGKADIAIEKRFDSVNEFRKSLDDMVNTLLPRSEYQVQHQALVEKVNDLFQRLLIVETAKAAKREGIGTLGAIVVGVLGGMGALAAVGALILAITKRG
jgi:hypothetical protein